MHSMPERLLFVACACLCSLDTVDDGNGARLSLEKILEELGTTFSYVSEFLRKVRESNSSLQDKQAG